MKFSHGTDSRSKDLFFVWSIGIMTGALVLLCLFSFFLGFYYMFTREPIWIPVLFWMVAVICVLGILDGTWRISRYEMDRNGISVSTFLRKRTVEWKDIQYIGIFPVRVRQLTTRNYILIFLTNEKCVAPITLQYCSLMRNDILAIRCTNDRAREFEKFLGKRMKTYAIDESLKFVEVICETDM